MTFSRHMACHESDIRHFITREGLDCIYVVSECMIRLYLQVMEIKGSLNAIMK